MRRSAIDAPTPLLISCERRLNYSSGQDLAFSTNGPATLSHEEFC